MRLLFLVGFLIGQIGLVVHAYEEHNSAELCEICTVSSHQAHALASASPEWLIRSSYDFALPIKPQGYSTAATSHFSARAPPAFL